MCWPSQEFVFGHVYCVLLGENCCPRSDQQRCASSSRCEHRKPIRSRGILKHIEQRKAFGLCGFRSSRRVLSPEECFSPLHCHPDQLARSPSKLFCIDGCDYIRAPERFHELGETVVSFRRKVPSCRCARHRLAFLGRCQSGYTRIDPQGSLRSRPLRC